ncbi:UDP-glucuronosyltransferase 2B7-like [Scaptodrosophila lebanonensis]|uniref:UDP-glucuronosyltransferase 2B7-like n=1 Tax=Drosophila lebanonensis TaxID=7225 RepID=A0A6J2T766_DROLE|nr:UDP-glucuronosyltransferase 2B7-like [Scaptodrosophila lebanonensis]
MGMTSHSHHIWNSVLLHELARRGHNLTILSVDLPRDDDPVPANVSYIYLERAYDMYNDVEDKMTIEYIVNANSFQNIARTYEYGLRTAKLIAASQGMQQLLDYPADFHFDLIINDYTLGPYMLGFAHRFRYPPIVGISAYQNPHTTLDFMSNTYSPALTPYQWTAYSENMNFLQRLHNTLIFAADVFYRRTFYNPALDEIMRPHFGAEMPPLTKLAKLTVIALVNSHPSIDYVESLPSHIIQVGGMHIGESKPLPRHLDDFMRSAKNGAVLISMGTNVQASDVAVKSLHVIVEAIRQLPNYNFLWKFDANYLKNLDINLPNNVLVSSFLPQRDVLAHKSLRAFVTHCGALSTQEATWHAVPIVGIPLFLDQYRNLRQSMDAGVALKVDYASINTKDLVNAIKDAAESEDIAAAMRKRSIRFRDNPLPSLELAVWWVEYLLRQPNPEHLHSPAKDMNIFQIHSLDVLAALLLVVVLIYYKLRQVGNKRTKHHYRKSQSKKRR